MTTIAKRLGPAAARNVRQAVARKDGGVQLYGGFSFAADADDRIIIKGTACGSAAMRPPRRMRIEPSAFKRAAREYLKNPQLFFHHDPHQPLGEVLSVDVRDTGPFIEAAIIANKDENGFPIPSADYIDLARLQVRTRTLRTFSVTVFPLKTKTEKVHDPRLSDAEVEIDVWQELDWWETSIVSIPGSRTATFEVSRLFANPFGDGPLPEEFERAYLGADDEGPNAEVTTADDDPETGQGERYRLTSLDAPKVEPRFKLITLGQGASRK